MIKKKPPQAIGDDPYWTDEDGNKRYGHLYVNETKPQVGLLRETKVELVGRPSNDIRPFEPNGDYERVPLPDGTEGVEIPVENATCEVYGVFVVDEGEVKATIIYDAGLDITKQTDTVDVAPGVIVNLKKQLTDD